MFRSPDSDAGSAARRWEILRSRRAARRKSVEPAELGGFGRIRLRGLRVGLLVALEDDRFGVATCEVRARGRRGGGEEATASPPHEAEASSSSRCGNGTHEEGNSREDDVSSSACAEARERVHVGGDLRREEEV